MTEERPNYDAPPTNADFNAEMERVIGFLKPGRNVTDYTAWAQEIKTAHGHEPLGRLHRAITLIRIQVDDIPPPVLFAMFMREAERQIATERRLNQGLLPLDEQRREREDRERYQAAYENVGPGTDAFEWGVCVGIAKQRKRRRLLSENPETKTDTAFRSPYEKEQFGPGLDEPTQEEIQAVYDERRAAGVPLGRNPTATSEYWSKHGGGWASVGNVIASRGWDKDINKFYRDGGFKPAREMLEERRREGRLEPHMEQYLLRKIEEEEAEGGA